MNMNICYTDSILSTNIIKEPDLKGMLPGKKPDSTESFKRILEDSMNSTPKNTAAAKGNSSDDSSITEKKVLQNGRNNDVKGTQVKTVKDNGAAVKAEPSKEASLDEAENTGKETGKDTIYNAAVGVLTELLGIEPLEAKKLMESLGITPENFSDASGMQRVIEKLGNLLKLDRSQKDTLLCLIQDIACEVEKALGSARPVSGKSPGEPGWIKVKNAVVKIADRLKEEIKIPEETKAAAIEFRLKLEKAVEDTASSISRNAAREYNAIEAAAGQDMDSLGTTKPESEPFVQKNEMSEGRFPEEGANREASIKSAMNSSTDGELSHSSENSLDNGEDQAARFNAVFNGSRVVNTNVNKVFKPENEVYLQKQEIVNQVIEKAQVLLTGDKSEMVINLKPDHLGKLSLKIVTENGMVAARIFAENQQVKHLLESNMQLLKESLERQGMIVQDFSVSVRQDSSRQHLKQHFHQGRDTKPRGGMAVINGIESSMASRNPSEGINPYDIYQSSINLTA